MPQRQRGALWRFLASSGISITGDGMSMTAAPLLAAALTLSPLEVSLVAAAQPLAWVFAGIPAGSTADRRPRRRVMICAWLASACVFGLLALLLQAGAARISLLIAVALLAGAIACYANAASAAVIPDLFTRDKQTLSQVNKWYWCLDSACRMILGPLLGAAAFAASRALPFLADAVSFAAAAVLARGLPRDRPRAASQSQGRPAGSLPAAAGLRHVVQVGELRAVVLGTGAYNCACNAADGILVLYAREVLGVPASWYGALLTAAAFGAVVAGWRGSRLADRLTYRRAVAACAAVQAAAWAVTAACGTVWVTAVCLAIIGGASVVVTVAGSNACQQLTPEILLGRVTAVYMIVVVGSAGLGAVCGGLVAAGAGLRGALVAAAGIAAVAGAVLWLLPARSPAGAAAGRRP